MEDTHACATDQPTIFKTSCACSRRTTSFASNRTGSTVSPSTDLHPIPISTAKTVSRTSTRLTELSTWRAAIPIFPKSSQTRKYRHLRFADVDISNCTYFAYSIYGNISFLLLYYGLLCIDCRLVRSSTGCKMSGIIYMLNWGKLGLR